MCACHGQIWANLNRLSAARMAEHAIGTAMGVAQSAIWPMTTTTTTTLAPGERSLEHDSVGEINHLSAVILGVQIRQTISL